MDYYLGVLQTILKVGLFSLVVSLIPSNFQTANANEILWNPTLSGDWDKPADLVPGAELRNQGIKVYKSNPDEIILQIQMAQSFEDRPFSAKGRNIAMWLYWPKDYCWTEKDANCEGLFTIRPPDNPASYPSVKSSEYVFVMRHNKASNVDRKPTECKAPWWIDSTFNYRDTLNFAVSITCLGLPKSFGTYAYSSIDIGQSNPATQFTPYNTISYPFYELAASAAAKNMNSTSTAQSGKQICVLATTGKGYDEVVDFEEQCSGSNSQWEFVFCDSHTKADLELYKNKKWQKIKTVKGINGICDDPAFPNEFTFKNSTIGKYRIKSYGNAKFTSAYLSLNIFRKDIA